MSSIVVAGDTSGTITLSAPATSGSSVLTLPVATDTLVGKATTDTLTNKTLTSPVIATIVNTGTLTLPTSTDTLVGKATTDTLTNKTLTSPVIATIVNTGTLTLPTSTDTLVGKATTDTLTNKTLTSPTISGAVVSSMASSVLTSGTAVASTSGTSIDFTGIPSWVKRVTVMLSGVSTSGSSPIQVQIGAGSVTTTGYTGQASSGSGVTADSTGFVVHNNVAAVQNQSGAVSIVMISTNNYVESGVVGGNSAANTLSTSCGAVALSGALDRVRITTVNGTDTFDAGSINIMYA